MEYVTFPSAKVLKIAKITIKDRKLNCKIKHFVIVISHVLLHSPRDIK